MRGALLVIIVGLTALGSGALGVEEPEAMSPRGYAAAAPESPDSAWWGAIDATYNGKYIWRGQNLVDDHVFQPSVTVGRGGLSLNIWGNRDMTSVNGQAGNFTEIDYTLDYSWEWNDLGLSVGGIYYDFPHDIGPGTVEVYGGVSLDTLLSPSLTVYVDIEEADGAYASLGVGHTFADIWQPAEGVSMAIDVSASVGFATANWNNFYFGVDKSAFTDALLTVGLPVDLGKGWAVTPALNYSALLDDDIRATFSDQSNFWAGLTLSYSF